MTESKLVFLSDIHIGSNTPTNWYQRDLHEPMLLAIFEHVIAQAGDVAEVVLLGDLADQWTYVPAARPPTLEEIAAANPAIFGRDGAIARTARAMPGRVTYMPGNHDMALTAEALSALTGEAIRGVTDALYEPAAGLGQVVCTHGHIYSIFNAPDWVGDPRTGLPLGHFITRLAALHASRKLVGAQTVADLPQSGDPTGTGLLGDAIRAILESFVTGELSLARAVVETLLDAVGERQDLAFQHLDGSSITAAAVIPAYDGLHERYGAGSAYPRATYGRDAATMALLGTDARNKIGHFAEVLSVRYPLIVMGHTHVPDGEAEDPVFGKEHAYLNTGFNCPSRPDMAARNSTGRVTFVEVTVDAACKTLSGAVRNVSTAGGLATVDAQPIGPVRVARMRA